MSPFVILAAHGAVDSPRSNQPLRDLANEVAARGDFAGVSPAFLNGQPLMTEVIDRWFDQEPKIAANDRAIIVVPVMTSQGYYLKKLPQQFAANRHFSQCDVVTTPVIGTRPEVATWMQRRIENHIANQTIDADETTVLVIGHGTRRNATSGETTLTLTRSLQASLHNQFPKLKFETGFLDQDPELASVVQSIKTNHVIALPFLISRGPHMTDDIPTALGLPTGPDLEFPLSASPDANQKILCETPLANYDELADLVVSMASSIIQEAVR